MSKKPRKQSAAGGLEWILFVLGVELMLGCDADRTPLVRLATTTSTHNSGLLDVVLPVFEQTAGVDVQVLVVGTGQALELGRRGDVDIVLVHAREREDAFVREGAGIDRRDVMWNEFVIAGPEVDPARVGGLRDATEALRRISAHRSPFVSRGDDSGTHIRENVLWERANGIPAPSGWYLSAGQGMGRSLILASEKQAYILTDRGTWLAFSDQLDLTVLVEGDPLLQNPYAAILVNPNRHPRVRHAEAVRLLDFLVSPKGQELIGNFRLQGQVLFHPVSGGR